MAFESLIVQNGFAFRTLHVLSGKKDCYFHRPWATDDEFFRDYNWFYDISGNRTPGVIPSSIPQKLFFANKLQMAAPIVAGKQHCGALFLILDINGSFSVVFTCLLVEFNKVREA